MLKSILLISMLSVLVGCDVGSKELSRTLVSSKDGEEFVRCEYVGECVVNGKFSKENTCQGRQIAKIAYNFYAVYKADNTQSIVVEKDIIGYKTQCGVGWYENLYTINRRCKEIWRAWMR